MQPLLSLLPELEQERGVIQRRAKQVSTPARSSLHSGVTDDGSASGL